MSASRLSVCVLLSALLGCSQPSLDRPASPPAPRLAREMTVAETFETPRLPAADVDSVAFWKGGAGEWLIATAKGTHVLHVYDAATGVYLRRVGGEGGELGRFRRPNGIAVAGDTVLVVERDNHRVQFLRLPDFEPVAVAGGEVLRRPYGLAVFPGADGFYDLFVTDDYETPEERIPPPGELGERVKHFRFRLTDALELEHVGSFGATAGAGALLKVETIAVDPADGRVLVAEEHESRKSVKVYASDGTFTGLIVGEGIFEVETEGIALYACGDGGWWIMTDQHEHRSQFRVFDRHTFAYHGTFVGELTANTDGVGLTRTPTSTFPAGAFFAVHDDQSVTAFDWRQVAAALELASSDC